MIKKLVVILTLQLGPTCAPRQIKGNIPECPAVGVSVECNDAGICKLNGTLCFQNPFLPTIHDGGVDALPGLLPGKVLTIEKAPEVQP